MHRFLILSALTLGLGAPALAHDYGAPPPRHHHGHRAAQPDCRPHHPATHSRGSDVAMRGDRHAQLPACGRRRGPLHHIFHGHRR
jgi:hypothetical protein